MIKISPVILCGGSGTRLWPLSRSNFPKQFLRLSSEISLFQESIDRLKSIDSKDIEIVNYVVVTNEEYKYMAEEQLKEMNIEDYDLILEPIGRNTCPAMTLAALQANDNYKDSIIVVTPADHTLVKKHEFQNALINAVYSANENNVIILGSKAISPETGYGYIERKDQSGNFQEYDVKRFIEKPDAERAQSFIKNNIFSWNSGIFIVKTSYWFDLLNNLCPDIFETALKIWDKKNIEGNKVYFDKLDFIKFEPESVDYAVMEKLPDSSYSLKMLEIDVGWSDLGSWPAVWEVGDKDNNGNVKFGDSIAVDCKNSLMHSNGRLVCGVGLDNIAVIETPDAVLVVNQNQGHAQNIKEVVNQLGSLKREEHIFNRKVHRPWGWYDSTDEGPNFKVKRIQVKPGASLSLQKHSKRAEHWVVVKGTAEVVNGDKTLILEENESTFIPLGNIHRLSNPKSYPLEIIEVQSGTYLGEDDIERFEDIYGRVKN